MRQMTMHDRMLAVLQGREHDKMPFAQYDNLIIPNDMLWSKYGRENAGVLQRTMTTRQVHEKCSIQSTDFTENGLEGKLSVMHTPKGDLREKMLYTPGLHSPAIVEHYVKKPSDYEVLLEYFRDITVCEDMNRYKSAVDYVGDAGLAMVSVSRTPFQQMWIFWVSLLDLCVDIVEYPDIVETCLECLGKIKVREMEIVAGVMEKMPVPLFNFPDNISAPMIGREYFRKYCLHYYKMAGQMLDTENTVISVHMDGDIKAIYDMISDSPITGLDSFTPKPDNDTGVAEALEMWPNMKLMMNFPSSVHLADEKTIYETALELLEQTNRSGRMWMQMSEDLPLGRWETNFPILMKAIDEYGPPMR